MAVGTYKIRGNVKPGVARLWHRLYPNDYHEIFRSEIHHAIRPASVVLEIGAGSGEGDQQAFTLKGQVSRYVGVDLDPRVMDNPHLDEAHICDAQQLPFPDNTFDLVFHTMVAEHLSRPVEVLKEIRRVLRPGGLLIFETVNKYYYPMVVAALTPHWFHNYYIRKFASGRKEEDVFPTVYKLNTAATIKSLAAQSGFSKTDVKLFSLPPGYLRASTFLFLLGVFYERTLEKLFRNLRGRLIARCVK
jgi:ubiquinone/menaquinone biosynthesis C-methylase UbiE